LQILFLGTGGSVPTVERGSPCIALREDGELIFLDCGEGTQRQLAFTNLRYGRLSKILITHLHGDHVLGLGGLLQTLSLSGRKKVLHIFGPPGTSRFLEALRGTLHFMSSFETIVSEIQSAGRVFETNRYSIEVCRADHENVFSIAYSIEEKQRPGEFFPEKARKLGVPEGPLWRKLQYGELVRLADGTEIHPGMVVGPNRPGRKIVYTGDTKPSKEIVSMSHNADVLIHDSTYDDSLTDKAAEYGHSTASQAAEVAKEANAKLLILTHISNRYRNEETLIEQAKSIFKNTIVARDFMSIAVPAAIEA
jgi:ribonuclease Z